ncbi:MAG: ribosome recycling factor [Burkholderiaceae bacterium]
MSIAEVMRASEAKMQKSLESLQTSLSKIRTGRASTGLLDHVMVDYYGSMVPVSQVASVTLSDSRTIAVTPWEKKLVTAIDKAIRDSDLGLNPATVGDLIRVPMPPLSEERRKELVKVVRGDSEQGKVAVRNLRRDANDSFKKLLKDKEISEDDERRAQDDIQKLTDRYIAEIDKILEKKEQEIMTV